MHSITSTMTLAGIENLIFFKAPPSQLEQAAAEKFDRRLFLFRAEGSDAIAAPGCWSP
jgi:hypothetical protein